MLVNDFYESGLFDMSGHKWGEVLLGSHDLGRFKYPLRDGMNHGPRPSPSQIRSDEETVESKHNRIEVAIGASNRSQRDTDSSVLRTFE